MLRYSSTSLILRPPVISKTDRYATWTYASALDSGTRELPAIYKQNLLNSWRGRLEVTPDSKSRGCEQRARPREESPRRRRQWKYFSLD